MSIMQKFTKKQLVLYATAFVIALINLLTLVFNIVSMDAEFLGTGVSSTVNGFSVIFEYPVALEDIGMWLSIYSLMHLAISIVPIVYFIYAFRKGVAEKLDSISKISIMFSCIMSAIYTVNGIITFSIAQDYGKGYVEVGTAAFIPLILIILLSVVYFVMKANLSDDLTGGASKTNAPTDSISELERYKELLDKGVITQDEFDAKKKELLGL